MLGTPVKPVGGSSPHQGCAALASLGLSTRLRAASGPAVVLGTSTRFAWCALDDEVVLLASPDAVRFPNAILAQAGWEGLAPGDQVLIGSGAVLGPGFDWQVVRWWDPNVTPTHAERREVLARVSSFAEPVVPPLLDLGAALVDGDSYAVIDIADQMVGEGGGLTPEGDDRLLGAWAAYRHITTSLGHPEGRAMVDELADEVLSIAARKTTLLSVTLLRHAFSGRVPDPVADVLHALTGHGNTSVALESCLALGDSSGRALMQGMVCGARAGCDGTS